MIIIMIKLWFVFSISSIDEEHNINMLVDLNPSWTHEIQMWFS